MFDTPLRSGAVDSVRVGNRPPGAGYKYRAHTPEGLRVHTLRPAWQGAEYKDLLCRQPDTYVHHGELRNETMG